MKTNISLYWILFVFFALVGVVYTLWTAIEYGAVEWVGVIALFLLAVLVGFLAFYLGKVYKSQGGELPEDRYDANIDDGDPELGHFSPWSWWPFMLGAGAATLLLGVATGAWLFVVALPFVAVALAGWVYEYYRGNFAH